MMHVGLLIFLILPAMLRAARDNKRENPMMNSVMTALRRQGRVCATTLFLGILCLFGACVAFAQDPAAAAAAPATIAIDKGDTAWMLASAALVLLMTPGLALFYGGMVRSKNVLNMLMQSFIAMAVVTLIWVVVGYSLAFAPGSSILGGMDYLGLNGVGQDGFKLNGVDNTIPHQVFMIYQMMFAIITPALISGAIAERMKFSAYVVFISLWSLVVYSPLAHMVWGEGGYLAKLGALDFAGGTVVHISSGVSALVLCIMLGKRRVSSMDDTRPHNLPMTLIGTGLLWFGWFGFNAGSAVASGGLAGSAFVVTHIAAATAGLVWTLIEWLILKKPTALGFATGAVAGLVAITPASGFVTPMASIAIGAGVSVVSYLAIKIKAKAGYDDTLDVFGVHGVGGMWGAVATGLFANKAVNSVVTDNGLLVAGGNATLLMKQLTAIGIAVLFAVVGTVIIAGILKMTIGLKVNEAEEQAGLDLTQHEESAYANSSLDSGAVAHQAVASAPIKAATAEPAH
jgi:ammonium transporter, Amt family